MTRSGPTPRTEEGSVLIMAVIAMLILGVLGVSFALLSRIETTVGFNFKQQAQAEALAEAALERARDSVRNAATATDGFTAWLNTNLWSAQTPTAYSGNAEYWYRARLDNDCAALSTVPASIEEPVTCADAGIRNTTDTNDTAVVTAWAQAGSGRARARAILSIDNAWRHVCSDHQADNGGLCNNDDNTNGNPSIQPADPNDPNGPATWEDLPRPYMGCSRIDPTLHGPAGNAALCAAYPNMYQYPYPTGFGLPRMVVTGPDPAVVTGALTCNPSGMKAYFGYFDCALATPCDHPATNCNGVLRKGCLDANHPAGFDASRFVKVQVDGAGNITSGCAAQGGTGMVFVGNMPDANWGDQTHRFTYYVFEGRLSLQDHDVYGTVVIEGDNGGSDELQLRTRGKLWTGPNTSPPVGTWGPAQYGYPLAALIWDPRQAMQVPSLPTSDGVPQDTTADMGSAGGGPSDRSAVHGLVFSGGHVEFNPVILDGGVIAWEIQTQATSAAYAYNYIYGNATPPPGFPRGGGTDVKMVRKSFIVCSSYSDDSGGATSCQ